MLFRTPIGQLIYCCAALASMPLHPAGAIELAPEQRSAIEGVIHDFLPKHPDVPIEALRAAEEKANRDASERARQALAVRRSELFDDSETPIGGNPKGRLTLVEFFDHRCPYCKQVQPRLVELLAGDRDIPGTPGFGGGDQIVPGAIEPSSLKELVAGARGK